jgi:hypothetical protein
MRPKLAAPYQARQDALACQEMLSTATRYALSVAVPSLLTTNGADEATCFYLLRMHSNLCIPAAWYKARQDARACQKIVAATIDICSEHGSAVHP